MEGARKWLEVALHLRQTQLFDDRTLVALSAKQSEILDVVGSTERAGVLVIDLQGVN